ncbi:U3 small nucleolar ribonucleoprotein MPP10 [Ooceraea biroi]|uniref:U3 small nucleolar ribonucleoprotein protein MPP10 n=1 Tax=Ooceraea biroi TaxID=2015173 RepID=A0A026WPC6_OOCBI|nr:U3 small nucleolar ribonucleoprotein MPP10 [Ooceraea biroi]
MFFTFSGKTKVDFKANIKYVYDFTKEQSRRKTNALPELVTKDFDEEQIWQQVELQNEGEITHLFIDVSKVLTSKQLMIPVCPTKPEPVQVTTDELYQEDANISDDKDSENENELKSSLKKRKTKQKKKKASIVDDKFFKLQELDEYLNKEEKKEKRNDRESDDESVDLFNDFSDEEDEDSEKKYIKYADFFDSPESENEQYQENRNSNHEDNIDDSEEEGPEDEDEEMSGSEKDENERKDKRVRFNLTNDSDETDSLDNKTSIKRQRTDGNEEEGTKKKAEPKSSLETRQERLLTRIKELEDEAIGEKPWQLKGEVSGTNRPQNSLLEEFVDFDITTRPAPEITEETTIKLEDIIKQRIKDKAWDDVEKKFKPVETPLEFKKKLQLDQQKSKESLSQIYEKEYLQQKRAADPENNEKQEQTPELHNEIRQKMRSLIYKLDALSNYHYTPKRAKPEIKIISNLPAINMEEVAPVATSDAVLLAPEEVKAKPRGDLIGKAERTKTDMKRERRQKKLRQGAKQKRAEEKEKEKALRPGIAKKYKNKNEKAALIKTLIKNRKITEADQTAEKAAKSSTAFFAKLQDQVKTQLKTKTASVSKKKDKKAKLKL